MASRTCPTCQHSFEGNLLRCPHDGSLLFVAAPAAPPRPSAPKQSSPLASSQPGFRIPVQPTAPTPQAVSPLAATGALPKVPIANIALSQPPAPTPREPSAPSIELLDTMSPEALEQAGLVLEPAAIHFNDPRSGSLEGKLLVGKYRIRRLLGEGGMGEVFEAEHEAIGKRIAIKILRHEHAQKADVVERFRLEARSASRIQHPNVVQVFDFGQLEDGRFYLALEYLEGLDLAEQLYQTKIIDPLRAMYITLQICAGLSAAHARGVIHRDMKPENVFLQPNKTGLDDVKIVDFGIAKMREISEHASLNPPPPSPSGERDRRITKAGSIFGTPEYMAPEQAAGHEVDHRADLYAVGIILYEMLTGRVPFTGDGMIETLTKHITEGVRPPRQLNPNISPFLESVILKALAKAPAQRYANMDALAEQLQLSPEGQRLTEMMRTASPLSLARIPSPKHSQPSPTEDQDRPSQAPLLLVTPSRNSTNIDHLESSAPSSLAPILPDPSPVSAGSLLTIHPASSLHRGLAASAIVAVLLGGSLAFLRPWSATEATAPISSTSPTPASSPNSIQEPSAAIPTPPPAITSTPTSAGSTPTATTIALHIVTIPTGAVIYKGGFQVCDTSPCDIHVEADEAVDLTALRGEFRGTAKVLAQRKQTVQIRLVKQARNNGIKPPSATSGRNVAPIPMCEFVDGDLKILRPCPK